MKIFTYSRKNLIWPRISLILILINMLYLKKHQKETRRQKDV